MHNNNKARKHELYHQHATETVSSKRASAAKARWTLKINQTHSSGCQDDSGSELEEMSIDDEELNEGHLVPALNPKDDDWTSPAGKKKLQRITSSLHSKLPSHQLDSLRLFVTS